MLNRSIKLTSEEYRKVLDIAAAIETSTGVRPSFSQTIGIVIATFDPKVALNTSPKWDGPAFLDSSL